jgi:hypothetical protein
MENYLEVEAMFKPTGFKITVRAYMTETNGYWKNKYPKLVKEGTYKPQMVYQETL